MDSLSFFTGFKYIVAYYALVLADSNLPIWGPVASFHRALPLRWDIRHHPSQQAKLWLHVLSRLRAYRKPILDTLQDQASPWPVEELGFFPASFRPHWWANCFLQHVASKCLSSNKASRLLNGSPNWNKQCSEPLNSSCPQLVTLLPLWYSLHKGNTHDVSSLTWLC